MGVEGEALVGGMVVESVVLVDELVLGCGSWVCGRSGCRGIS